MAAEGTRIIGRYALAGEIASGGMATIHLGRLLGPAGFTRNVAIKRLHPHLAKDAQFLAMFADEARIAARIHHPNVVSTLDVVAEDGELVVVMDYVEGLSLSTLVSVLDGARAPLGVVIAIVSDVLHGLHAAHGATSEAGEPLDIIHRDVSPQNVMIGVDGIARLVDFGIAKARGRMQASTLEGSLKGKLRYMSPEQVRGLSVTRQSDIYSASIVLWELLTGRRLFAGTNEGNVLEQVLLGDVEAPSRFAPALPADVEEVTLRGLQHDLTKRFGTAREMATALRACAAPASATEVSEWLRAVASDRLEALSRRVSEVEGSLDTASEAAAAPPTIVQETTERLPSTSRAPAPSAAAEHGTAALYKRRLASGIVVFLLLLGISWAAWSRLADAKRPVASTERSDGEIRASPPSSAPSETDPVASTPAGSEAQPTNEGPVAHPRAHGTNRSKRSNTPPNAAKGPAGVDCTVPYTVDADGNKLYKRACLK